MSLPQWYRTVLEAYAAADHLRTAGDLRPMRVIPLADGQGLLKYDDEGDQPHGQNDDTGADYRAP